MVAALGIVLVAAGCGQFARDNPFDPAVPVTLTLAGPDSAFAQLDTLRFSVTTDPAYDFDPPEWTVFNLEPLDEPGAFRVPRPDGSAVGATWTAVITVRIGERSVTKFVGIDLKPVRFTVGNCVDGTKSVLLESLEVPGFACLTFYDERGLALGPGLATTLRSLDSTVVKVRDTGLLESVGNGTTQVVYEWQGQADTVHFTVKQTVAIATPALATCRVDLGTALAVGDTLRIGIGPPYYDATSHAILDSATIQAARATPPRWQPLYGGSPHATITPDGLVTAISPGYAYFGSIWYGYCSFVIR
jgi:hypothetical protein